MDSAASGGGYYSRSASVSSVLSAPSSSLPSGALNNGGGASFVWRSTLLAAGIQSAPSATAAASHGGGAKTVLDKLRENRTRRIGPIHLELTEEKWKRAFDECYEQELTRIRSAFNSANTSPVLSHVLRDVSPREGATIRDPVALEPLPDAVVVAVVGSGEGDALTTPAWSAAVTPEVSPARRYTPEVAVPSRTVALLSPRAVHPDHVDRTSTRPSFLSPISSNRAAAAVKPSPVPSQQIGQESDATPSRHGVLPSPRQALGTSAGSLFDAFSAHGAATVLLSGSR